MEQPLSSWLEEMHSATLYSILAREEKNPSVKNLFSKLGEAALHQAEIWKAKLPPHVRYKPTLRVRIVARLIPLFGARKLKSLLAAMKIRGLSALSAKEDQVGHHIPLKVEEIGLRHKGSATAGNLRAGIFGINDGLVSTASLMMGLFGAAQETSTILIAAVSGVLAGAFSMAAGEYVSVRSQREMVQYQLGLEEEELMAYPEEEAMELSLIYQARGLEKEAADHLANTLIGDPKKGLQTLAREELGVDPDDLVSPWGAAIYSFISFSIGGMIPLLSLLVKGNFSPFVFTAAITAAALFIVGAILSLWTGRAALLSGLRMMAIGMGAGALTYAIGLCF